MTDTDILKHITVTVRVESSKVPNTAESWEDSHWPETCDMLTNGIDTAARKLVEEILPDDIKYSVIVQG